jgi:hypothetical protein
MPVRESELPLTQLVNRDSRTRTFTLNVQRLLVVPASDMVVEVSHHAQSSIF